MDETFLSLVDSFGGFGDLPLPEDVMPISDLDQWSSGGGWYDGWSEDLGSGDVPGTLYASGELSGTGGGLNSGNFVTLTRLPVDSAPVAPGGIPQVPRVFDVDRLIPTQPMGPIGQSIQEQILEYYRIYGQPKNPEDLLKAVRTPAQVAASAEFEAEYDAATNTWIRLRNAQSAIADDLAGGQYPPVNDLVKFPGVPSVQVSLMPAPLQTANEYLGGDTYNLNVSSSVVDYQSGTVAGIPVTVHVVVTDLDGNTQEITATAFTGPDGAINVDIPIPSNSTIRSIVSVAEDPAGGYSSAQAFEQSNGAIFSGGSGNWWNSAPSSGVAGTAPIWINNQAGADVATQFGVPVTDIGADSGGSFGTPLTGGPFDISLAATEPLSVGGDFGGPGDYLPDDASGNAIPGPDDVEPVESLGGDF